MCGDIMGEVSGCRLSAIPGILRGYSRRSVKGEHYPALLPDADGRVEGVLYRDVPDSAWRRLDRFEGDMYARQVVQIELNDGASLPAATYVVRPEFLDQLEQSEWDLAEFLRRGKARFRRRYKGYSSI